MSPGVHDRRLTSQYLAPLALFILAFAFYLPTAYRFGLDEAQYLFTGIRLSHGAAPLDVSGNTSIYRIGYVAYFGVLYWIGGLTGASLAPFAALAGFVSLLFIVGRSLFGTTVAAVACGLYLLTPRERHLTAQLIDGANALTMLLVFHLMNVGRGGDERRVGAILAWTLFGAFLVKETALLLAPLPLLRLLTRVENASFQRVRWFYISIVLLMAAYAVVWFNLPTPPSYFRSDDLAVQTFPIVSEGGTWPERILATIGNMVYGFYHYFHSSKHLSSLDHFAWIAVLFPIGLARSMVGAVRGRIADRNVLTALLCFVPLMSAVGWIDWRPEHCLMAIGLLYILLARLIVDIADLFILRKLTTLLAYAALALSLLYQDIHGANLASQVPNQLNALLHGDRPELHVSLFGEPALTAELASTVQPGGQVWSSPELTGLSSSIGSGERFWTAPVPTHVLGMPGFTSGFNKAGPAAVRGPIWGVFGPAVPSVDEPLFLIYRRDLEDGQSNVSSLVTSPSTLNGYKPLLAMMDGNVTRTESVQVDKDFGATWLSTWDTDLFAKNIGLSFIHETAIRQLDHLRQASPERYRWYIEKLREGGISVSTADLADLLQNRNLLSIHPVRAIDPAIPPQPYALGSRVGFTAADRDPYISTGWAGPEAAGTWTDGPRARLSFRLKVPSSGLMLSVSYVPYLPPGQPPPIVTIDVAGKPVTVWRATVAGETTRCAAIPANLIGSKGELDVTFEIAGPPSPSELHWLDDPRHLGILVKSLTIDEASKSPFCAP